MIVGAVDDPQAFVHVLQADSAPSAGVGDVGHHAQAVVDDLDHGVAPGASARDGDAAAADLARDAVLDGVLHQGLQQHAGHELVEGLRGDALLDDQRLAEADGLDVEVLVDRRDLLPQGDEVLLAPQQPAQQAGQLADQHAGGLGLRADEGRDGRQRVEQEVGVDLAREGLDPGLHEKLLLLLQPVLDARGVPDLDRDRDRHDRRQHDDRHQPDVRRLEGEEPLGAEPVRERLPQQLEADRPRHQGELPVDAEPAREPPRVPVQGRHEQRAHVPNRLLGGQLAQSAARESAADHEDDRDPLAGQQGRQPDEAADDRPGVGAGDESREERAGEGEVGRRVVLDSRLARRVGVEEEPGDDPDADGDAEGEGERQTLAPSPLLGEEDPAELAEPDQHGGEGRRQGDLDHEGGQQRLLDREEPAVLGHGQEGARRRRGVPRRTASRHYNGVVGRLSNPRGDGQNLGSK